MNREELYSNFIEAVTALIEIGVNHLFCAAPGIVVANNGDGTAQVQLAVLFQKRGQDGNWTNITPSPTIPKAILGYPGDANFVFTFPCGKGTEGLLVFCDRSIDGWWQNGQISPQMDIRQHSLTDAWFIPCGRSKPNAVQNVNQTSAELRTISGNTKITFDDTNGIVLKGKLTLAQGDLVMQNGNFTTTGGVTAGQGTGDQVTLQHHTHPANGSPPTPGT